MLNEPTAIISITGLSCGCLIWIAALYNSHATQLDCHHAHEVIYDIRLHFFIMMVYMGSYATYFWTLTVINDHFNKRGQLRVWIRRATLSLCFRTFLIAMWTWSFLYKKHTDLFACFVMGTHLFILLIEFVGVSISLWLDEVTMFLYILAATMVGQVASIVILSVSTAVHLAHCA